MKQEARIEDRSERRNTVEAGKKRYEAPVLVKGPALSAITAEDGSVSGASRDVCWVARAAFGEADIRWMIFRAWLLEDAPIWFRAAYLRYGERTGRWLADREHARAVVRAAMMPTIRRKVFNLPSNEQRSLDRQ